MNCYQPSTPRAKLGLTALAMVVITMGVLVVLPAKLETVGVDADALATATLANTTCVDVAGHRIEFAYRTHA